MWMSGMLIIIKYGINDGTPKWMVYMGTFAKIVLPHSSSICRWDFSRKWTNQLLQNPLFVETEIWLYIFLSQEIDILPPRHMEYWLEKMDAQQNLKFCQHRMRKKPMELQIAWSFLDRKLSHFMPRLPLRLSPFERLVLLASKWDF